MHNSPHTCVHTKEEIYFFFFNNAFKGNWQSEISGASDSLAWIRCVKWASPNPRASPLLLTRCLFHSCNSFLTPKTLLLWPSLLGSLSGYPLGILFCGSEKRAWGGGSTHCARVRTGMQIPNVHTNAEQMCWPDCNPSSNADSILRAGLLFRLAWPMIPAPVRDCFNTQGAEQLRRHHTWTCTHRQTHMHTNTCIPTRMKTVLARSGGVHL